MKVAGGGPALESQVLEYSAAGADVRRTLRQGLAPLAPLLAVEFCEGGTGFTLLLGFAAGEDFQEGLRCGVASGGIPRGPGFPARFSSNVRDTRRILFRCRQCGQECPHHTFKCHAFVCHILSCGMQLFDPLHHDLNVAQSAEPLKQAPAGLLHRFPVGIGIDSDQAVGHGAAPAQADAKVMDRVGAEVGGDMLALFEDTQHPVAQAGRLLHCFLLGDLLLCDLLLRDLGDGDLRHRDIGCDALRGAALRDVGRRWQSSSRNEPTVSFSPADGRERQRWTSRVRPLHRMSLYCETSFKQG